MYKVEFLPSAEKYLEKLPAQERQRILEKLDEILPQPFAYLKKLQASPFWSLRVGKNRAIVDVIVKGKRIIVLRIGKRSNVY